MSVREVWVWDRAVLLSPFWPWDNSAREGARRAPLPSRTMHQGFVCFARTGQICTWPVACSVGCKSCTPLRCRRDFVSVAGVACTAGRCQPWCTRILPASGRCQAGSWLSLLWSPSWASQQLGTPTPSQQPWGPCPGRPGSRGLCHGTAWLGRAGSSVRHTMHRACPCLLLQDPAPSRRVFPTFSEAQESPAQPLQPVRWEAFAPNHKAMAKGAGTAEPVW